LEKLDMTRFKTLGAAVMLSLLTAPPVLAQTAIQERGANASYHPNSDGFGGREVAAPSWSAACMTDHGPSQCDEPMWVYGSSSALARYKNAF
jgi:hypothetical protein